MSFQNFINASHIFSKYCPKGLQETGMFGADHDGGNWSKSV